MSPRTRCGAPSPTRTTPGPARRGGGRRRAGWCRRRPGSGASRRAAAAAASSRRRPAWPSAWLNIEVCARREKTSMATSRPSSSPNGMREPERAADQVADDVDDDGDDDAAADHVGQQLAVVLPRQGERLPQVAPRLAPLGALGGTGRGFGRLVGASLGGGLARPRIWPCHRIVGRRCIPTCGPAAGVRAHRLSPKVPHGDSQPHVRSPAVTVPLPKCSVSSKLSAPASGGRGPDEGNLHHAVRCQGIQRPNTTPRRGAGRCRTDHRRGRRRADRERGPSRRRDGGPRQRRPTPGTTSSTHTVHIRGYARHGSSSRSVEGAVST